MKTNKSNFPTEISKQFSLENASFRRSTFKQALVPLKTSTRKYKEKQIIFKKNDYGYESYKILKGSVGVYIDDPNDLLFGQDKNLVKTLCVGEEFGELALFRENKKRTATCKALSDNTTLKVVKRITHELDHFKCPRNNNNNNNENENESSPSRFSSSDGINVEEISFEPGEYITKEGEHGNAFYIITEGVVDVTVHDVKVNQMASGQIFGEKAILNPDHERTANCIAKNNVKILRFTVQL